jgi:hypothetical protein
LKLRNAIILPLFAMVSPPATPDVSIAQQLWVNDFDLLFMPYLFVACATAVVIVKHATTWTSISRHSEVSGPWGNRCKSIEATGKPDE